MSRHSKARHAGPRIALSIIDEIIGKMPNLGCHEDETLDFVSSSATEILNSVDGAHAHVDETDPELEQHNISFHHPVSPTIVVNQPVIWI